MAQAQPRVRVVFIAGTGRSGSTLLARLLGQADGVFTAGELRYLWRRGIVEGRLCGCHASVCACPVWSGVLDRLPAGLEEAARLDAELRRVIRGRRLPLLLLDAARRRSRRSSGEAQRELSALLTALADETGARWIVDSSKLPAYGQLLTTLPDVDVVVVHLVRDARAAAFSWQRWRELPDDAPQRWMQRQSAAKSASLWLFWNALAELLWRRRPDVNYLRLRYEDLIADPQAAVDAVLARCGEPAVGLPLTSDGRILLPLTHAVAGNPDRLGAGAIRFATDAEWQHSMRRRQRWLVSALTFPLLRHHGYALRHRRDHPRHSREHQHVRFRPRNRSLRLHARPRDPVPPS